MKIYPDTKSFHFYNANPKNRKTEDCSFRALSTALTEDYNNVVMQSAELMCRTGYALDGNKGIENYLLSKGWIKMKQPRKADNTKYTGEEFCNWLSINYPNAEIGNIAANIGGHHIVAIKPTYEGDGFNCCYKIYDIWNSSYGCIGNYYIKSKIGA